VDNGSADGTYEYFQSVPYHEKKVIQIQKNLGASFPFQYIKNMFTGKYLIFIPNDVYVTENWLANLLRCMESDDRIGMAMPVSSNVSNLQEVDLGYVNMAEMQAKAALFNQSDPSKWEERMRLISIINLFSRSAMDIVGILDPAFVHDFMEDDFAVRLRRAGFKLVLCRDTFICHDHDFRNLEEKNAEDFQQSLNHGRDVYRQKYHGIDPWDDILNFENQLLSFLDSAEIQRDEPRVLTVDVRCGTPMLEIRNHLKRRGILDIRSYAFTTNAKYFLDLQTVAEDVQCDRMEFIQDYYSADSLDIIMMGEPVNTYMLPVMLLRRLLYCLAPGGMLLFKLRNTLGIHTLLRSLNMGGRQDPDYPVCISMEAMNEAIQPYLGKGAAIQIIMETEAYSPQDVQTIQSLITKVKGTGSEEDIRRLTASHYLYCVQKGRDAIE
jgi:glycosyltransferase involved in cell wall biosynthesis